MIILKSPREIELMAKAGYVTAGALQVVKEAIAPGISTGELDRLVDEFFQKQGAIRPLRATGVSSQHLYFPEQPGRAWNTLR